MNKLKFISLAVVCGMALASCVDNEESASVENLRNQKAAQYAAVAELNKANAGAALIKANAEKVLMEAQAAYQNALAAVEQAKADKDQVAVELAKLKLEKAKATLEADIAKLQADAEVALLSAQKLLMEAQNAAKDQKNDRLLTLTQNYGTAIADLHTATTNLLTAKATLAKAELDLAGFEETQFDLIKEQQEIIVINQALVVAYEAIPNEYAAIKAASKTASAKAEALGVTSGQYAQVLAKQNVTYTTATTQMDTSVFAINAAYIQQSLPAAVVEKWVYPKKTDKYGNDMHHGSIESIVSIDANDVAAYLIDLNKIVKIVQETYDTAVAVKGRAVKAEDAAYAAYVAAQTDLVKRQAWLDAQVATRSAEATYQSEVTSLTNVKENAARWSAAQAAVSDMTAYNELVAAVFAANDACIDAKIEANYAYNEFMIQLDLFQALEEVLNNTDDYASYIATYKSNILEAEKVLVDLKNMTTQEEAVAAAKNRVTEKEAIVKAKQIDADYIKSLLDAEMPQ